MNSIREQLHEFLKENCDNGYGLDYADLHEQQQREIIEDLLQNLEDGQVRLKGKYVKVGKSDLFEVAGESRKSVILSQLRELEHCIDYEASHIEADYLLCELLSLLGHQDVVDAFNDLRKWYA